HIEADLGTLAAGQTKNIPLKLTANAGGAQATEVTATGDGGLESSAKATANILQPQLQVRKSGPTKVLYRGEVNEELELSNPGNAPADNVMVTEILPVGLDFIAAPDGAVFDPACRAVTWRLGQHPAGTARKLTLKAKATSVGDQITRT